MEKLKAFFNKKTVRQTAAAVVVLGLSGTAMAATDGAASAFDVSAFTDPVVSALKENMTSIMVIVGGVFAVVWGSTSGITIVKKFLSKAVS